MLARGPHNGRNELRHLGGDGHLVRRCHQPLEIASPAHRLQPADGVRVLLALDQPRFGRRIGVTQRQADQKAVKLRLGQRVGARHVDGVLRGQHGERGRQRQGLPVQRDLPLFHALEQGRLGARVGAVDLVGQHDVGEHRAGAQGERAILGVVDRPAHDIGRHEVGRELDALERQAHRHRQRARQHGLAQAGHVLDQQVPAGHDGGERQFHLLVLALQDFFDIVDDGLRRARVRLLCGVCGRLCEIQRTSPSCRSKILRGSPRRSKPHIAQGNACPQPTHGTPSPHAGPNAVTLPAFTNREHTP